MTISDGHIRLKGLRFHAYHGVLLQERQVGAAYRVDLTLQCDLSCAATTDQLGDTLNYAEVYETVKGVMAVPSQLLENVAYRIGEAVCQSFPAVRSLEVSVTKLNPPIGADCEGATVTLHLINNKTQT